MPPPQLKSLAKAWQETAKDRDSGVDSGVEEATARPLAGEQQSGAEEGGARAMESSASRSEPSTSDSEPTTSRSESSASRSEPTTSRCEPPEPMPEPMQQDSDTEDERIKVVVVPTPPEPRRQRDGEAASSWHSLSQPGRKTAAGTTKGATGTSKGAKRGSSGDGKDQRPAAAKIKKVVPWIPCAVCGAKAAGFHFGAFTCEGCKSFFGRCNMKDANGEDKKKPVCDKKGECDVRGANRKSCQGCRYKKCLEVNMSRENTRFGRRPANFQYGSPDTPSDPEEPGTSTASAGSPALDESPALDGSPALNGSPALKTSRSQKKKQQQQQATRAVPRPMQEEQPSPPAGQLPSGDRFRVLEQEMQNVDQAEQQLEAEIAARQQQLQQLQQQRRHGSGRLEFQQHRQASEWLAEQLERRQGYLTSSGRPAVPPLTRTPQGSLLGGASSRYSPYQLPHPRLSPSAAAYSSATPERRSGPSATSSGTASSAGLTHSPLLGWPPLLGGYGSSAHLLSGQMATGSPWSYQASDAVLPSGHSAAGSLLTSPAAARQVMDHQSLSPSALHMQALHRQYMNGPGPAGSLLTGHTSAGPVPNGQIASGPLQTSPAAFGSLMYGGSAERPRINLELVGYLINERRKAEEKIRREQMEKKMKEQMEKEKKMMEQRAEGETGQEQEAKGSGEFNLPPTPPNEELLLRPLPLLVPPPPPAHLGSALRPADIWGCPRCGLHQLCDCDNEPMDLRAATPAHRPDGAAGRR